MRPAAGRRAIGIAVNVGYTTASYIVYGTSASVQWLSYVKPLTLCRRYLSNDPLNTGLGVEEVIVMLAVCITALVVGSSAFVRRDLHA